MIPFRTVSGRRIDLERPRSEDITIEDIACGLSRICRFNGQLPEFYSVAEHSIFVAELVDPQLRLAALLHDASEAYLGDVSRNLKHSPALAGYRALESLLQGVIEDRFGLRFCSADRHQIKIADDLAATWERVVVRDRGSWARSGAATIQQVVQEGWVGTSLQELEQAANRIPPGGHLSMDVHEIEQVLLLKFEDYR